MNDFDSKLNALDAMNSSTLWMTWTTPGHEHRALDAMNDQGYDGYEQLWVMSNGL